LSVDTDNSCPTNDDEKIDQLDEDPFDELYQVEQEELSKDVSDVEIPATNAHDSGIPNTSKPSASPPTLDPPVADTVSVPAPTNAHNVHMPDNLCPPLPLPAQLADITEDHSATITHSTSPIPTLKTKQ
jgi:hypothetical protein